MTSGWVLGVLLTALLVSIPATALAVQQHGGLEGLVAHQLGHLLFLTGMVFLLYRLRHPQTRPLVEGRGWYAFRLFIWLIILWNLLTFYGHWHDEVISADKFVLVDGKRTALIINHPLDLLYYFSRLDHLILLPAFLCLLQALRRWRAQG